METNAVGWFEIPVTDMEREMKFYEAVVELKLTRVQMGEEDMAFFPWIEGKSGAAGSLIQHDYYKPSTHGVLIYFASADGDIELARVEAAGGKIIKPKTLITKDIGYSGAFIDSEGNHIAVHSRK